LNASLPLLKRDLVRSGDLGGGTDVIVPTAEMLELPERAMQFGTGRFLRGFVSYFLDVANHRGLFRGRSVMVGSTSPERVRRLNAQDGLFTLVARGIRDGEARRETRIMGSVSRALDVRKSWGEVLGCARGPDLQVIFSNTTEAGIRLDEGDDPDGAPPRSFPGKLACVLRERALAFDFDPAMGVAVVPCELIEDNGGRLREIVLALARRWDFGDQFSAWLDAAVPFAETLVDRIVPGAPDGAERAEMERALGYRDEMLTTAELFRLFVIRGDERIGARLALEDADDDVRLTDDLTPYRERKLRLLNAPHTLLVPTALLCGHATVRDAVENEFMARFLRRVLFEELVPTVNAAGAPEYARGVIERFLNPFVRHELFDISLQGTMKMRVRVVPSIVRYVDRTGSSPAAMAFGFAAFLLFMRGDLQERRRTAGLSVPDDDGTERLRAIWKGVGADGIDLGGLVRRALSDDSLWGVDLCAVAGFAEAVAEHLLRAVRHGPRAALEAHLRDLEI